MWALYANAGAVDCNPKSQTDLRAEHAIDLV